MQLAFALTLSKELSPRTGGDLINSWAAARPNCPHPTFISFLCIFISNYDSFVYLIIPPTFIPVRFHHAVFRYSSPIRVFWTTSSVTLIPATFMVLANMPFMLLPTHWRRTLTQRDSWYTVSLSWPQSLSHQSVFMIFLLISILELLCHYACCFSIFLEGVIRDFVKGLVNMKTYSVT